MSGVLTTTVLSHFYSVGHWSELLRTFLLVGFYNNHFSCICFCVLFKRETSWVCRARGQLSTVIRWLYLHFWKTVTRWWWFLGNSIFLCGFHLARKPSHLTSLPHFQNWYNELTWTKIVDCILLGLRVEPHKEIRKEDCMWGCSTLYVCEVTVRQVQVKWKLLF